MIQKHQTRTTLNIEDGALATIKKYAEEREISLGQAASDLVHRWVVFNVPPGTPPLTHEILDKWEIKQQVHHPPFGADDTLSFNDRIGLSGI